MKFQSCFLAATAAATMVGVAAPAHAFNFTFNNTAITFSANTTVDFSFVSSQGKFRSALGVMEVGASGPISNTFSSLFSEQAGSDNGSANDWLATCGGKAIPMGSCSTSFNFLAGKTYTLALSRPQNTNQVSAGYVYSTDAFNTSYQPPNTYRQAFFSGDLFSAAGLTINFEDIGGKYNRAARAACAATGSTPTGDCDFNDFIVTARADAPTSVPEPTAMVGLGVAAVGLMSSRRRKANPAS